MPDMFRVLEDVRIPLADGRQLAARIWLPEGVGAAPAILEYLPYRKRDGTAPRDATTYPVFAEAGYAGVRVDLPGSGESDGHLSDEYCEDELAVGEEVIAWIADQPWCSGAVGMIGISWGGFNGLQIAMRRPPALKGVVSVCSTVDRFADDIHYMGGALLTDNFNWGAQMTAYMTRPPDPRLRNDWRDIWMERMERLPFYAADWLRHPTRDQQWRHGSVCEDWSAIEAPVLAIGGWADSYINAPPYLAANLKSPVKALIGPWEHKYPHIARINPADFHGEVIRWFDRWLKGAANEAEDLPALRAFIQEHDTPSPLYGPRTGRWVGEPEWPSEAPAEVFHLTNEGLAATAGSGVAQVRSPQHVGQAAAYYCPGMRVDNELSHDQAPDDALSTCFETPPLTEPIELLGQPEVEITFTVDNPAALLCLRICDVAPDGSSVRVSYRPFNLTHHASHAAPEALTPGQRYAVRIPMNHCGHRFRAGNRMRLALSTSYWPVVWPSPEQATVDLHLEECRLLAPVRRSEVEVDPMAPPAPRPFPRIASEILRGSASRTERRILADGSHELSTFDDYGEEKLPGHHLIEASTVGSRFTIHPDDPLSARHETSWRFEFRREDGWDVSIDSESVMTADAAHFQLTRQVTATERGEQVYHREWVEKIPRGFN